MAPNLDLNLSPPPWLGQLDVLIPDNHSDLRDYLARLETELTRIDHFMYKMPLSFLLLTTAVARLREEVGRTERDRVRTACDFNEAPRAASEVTISDKTTWMRSAQLWTVDQTSLLQLDTKKTPEATEKKAGAFADGFDNSPVREDIDINKPADSSPALSLKVAATGVKMKGGGQGVHRKTFVPIFPDEFNQRYQAPTSSASESPEKKRNRRSWTPELHRRFIHALDILGGSQVATPKQIKDQMQVIGLTNDEVKSHLQKYRLHIRKFPSSRANSAMANLFSCHDIGPEVSGGGGGGSVWGPTLLKKKVETTHSGSSQGSLPIPMPIKPAKCNSTAGSRCQSIEPSAEDRSDSRSHGWGGV